MGWIGLDLGVEKTGTQALNLPLAWRTCEGIQFFGIRLSASVQEVQEVQEVSKSVGCIGMSGIAQHSVSQSAMCICTIPNHKTMHLVLSL